MKKPVEPLSQEQGTLIKKWTGKMAIGLVFPNVYHLAMSNLGMQQVYAIANARSDVVCERVFLPEDADQVPVSVESGRVLSDFSVILCCLSFESDYLNLIKLFLAAGLAPLAEERQAGQGRAWPLVIAGGVATFINPEPMAPFIDMFVVGDAEVLLPALLDRLLADQDAPANRQQILDRCAAEAGYYVPAKYSYRYDSRGHIAGFQAAPGALMPVKKRLCLETEQAGHSTLLTPNTEFANLFLVELGRGCSRGCRFCAAGFVYRPPRLWDSEAIVSALAQKPADCGRVGLLGMEMTDPAELAAIAHFLEEQHCSLSFSSLRADALNDDLLSLLKSSKLKTAAIAPDGASERLRAVINKGLDKDDVIGAARSLVAAGISNLKLYFMIGLPGEQDDDLAELVELVGAVKAAIDEVGRARGRLATITVSLNSFVPKACTPFQYAAFAGVPELKRRIKMIRQQLQPIANVKLKVDKPDNAFFQAVLARGDRRLAPALLEMAGSGRNWRQVLKQHGIDPLAVVGEFRQDAVFCWQIIDHGMNNDYLWQEYVKALAGKTTMACDTSRCRRCGVCGDESEER